MFVVLHQGPFDCEDIDWPEGAEICVVSGREKPESRYRRRPAPADHMADYILVPAAGAVSIVNFDEIDAAAVAAGESAEDPPADADAEDDNMLLGSDLLPALIDIAPGVQIQLGTLVARAHREWLGLLEDPAEFPNRSWNELPNEDREALLQSELTALRNDAAQVEYSNDNVYMPGAEQDLSFMPSPSGDPVTVGH